MGILESSDGLHKTVSEDQAENVTQELYKTARESMGYIPNHIKTFSLRPEFYEAWSKLLGSFQSHMRLRWYELMTFATALELKCTSCLLAHVTVLRKNFFNAEQIIAIVKDFKTANLTPEEVTLMAFTRKIAKRASDMSEANVEVLRAYGLMDEENLDVMVNRTARNFFNKTFDAFTAKPDEMYLELQPELVQVLTMGITFPLQLNRRYATWKLIELKLI